MKGVEGHGTRSSGPGAGEAADAPSAKRYRVAPVQERFWLLHELHRESPLCNEAIALRLRGPLDPARLQRALNGLIAAHDPLRTRFVQTGGELEAEVAAEAECPLQYEDLSGSNERAQQARLDAVVRARFDLTCSPLIRALLARLGADDHVLLLVAHHAVIDGRSLFDALPRELAARYADPDAAFAAHTSFAAFAHAAREAEHSAAAEGDLEYFRSLLENAPSALPLPVDRPHPPRATMRGVHVELPLGAAMRERTYAIAEQLGVRPFDVACAAFTAQLMRYSGQLDLVLGTPIANRGGRDGSRALIGCFMDTLLVRLRFDAAPRFAELARAIHAQRRASAAHRSLSFGTLVDALAAPRDGARNPLYQVMFNYMDFSVADVPFPGLEVRAERRPAGTAMLDLSLDVTEQNGGYLVALEANADVFEPDHVARMLHHFVALLEHALDAPDAELGALRMLDADELRRITTVSRGPALLAAEPALFHRELIERARAFPEAIALRSDTSTLSYAALWGRVAELAARLHAKGLKPGEFVLVHTMSDPADTVVALLAVLAAGGAFVPLDGSQPIARQRAITEDCGARLAIGDAPTHELSAALAHVPVRPWPAPTQELAPEAERAAALPPLPRVPELTPEHPAYLLYTSGSTGTPKGVLVRHRNLTHQLRARLAAYDDPPGVMFAPYSFAFDSALAGLSWTLAVGGELRLLDDTARRDLRRLREVLGRGGVTHLDVVPSLYAALLDGATPRAFPQLRGVICGGEALPPNVVQQHFQTLPGVRLWNEYGPTEATVFASVQELKPGPIAGATPIGRPIPGAQCWVYDAFGALAPLGHDGELFIGGEGVAAGYLNRPDESTKRFVPDPHTGGDKARLYRTGDRVRYRGDGALEFLGRVDDQVQVRGYRVELAEIEAALSSLPGIAEAAAVLREDGQGRARLLAYVVFNARSSRSSISTRDELGPALRHKLPGYMVPEAFVPMPALPRTHNGKVDRRALPLVNADDYAERVYVAPRTALERELCGLFEQVLGRSRCGVHDNFFDCGGHSLLAVKLVDLIASRTGREIALADLAAEPTPEAIARVLEGTRAVQRRCLDVIAASGPGVPFVFVGAVAQARLLARHLAPMRAMYGLNLFGLHEPGVEPRVSVPELVEFYLRELRDARPRGPYAIAGYCQDAKVAVEMARVLRAQGESVPLIALIDAVYFVEQLLPTRSVGRTAFSKNVSPFDGLYRIAYRLKRIATYGYEDVRRMLSRAERDLRQRLGLELPALIEHRMLFTSYLDALEKFEAPPITEGVALYMASEWGLRDEDLQNLGGISVHRIPSYHEALFEGPQLIKLAAAVQRDLALADERAGLTSPASKRSGVYTRGFETEAADDDQRMA